MTEITSAPPAGDDDDPEGTRILSVGDVRSASGALEGAVGGGGGLSSGKQVGTKIAQIIPRWLAGRTALLPALSVRNQVGEGG